VICVFDKARFADNLKRLIGSHGLTSKDAARLIASDPATFSHWMNSKRQPSIELGAQIERVLEISPVRLADAAWIEIVQNELSDEERHARVERRIRRALHPPGKPRPKAGVTGGIGRLR
jgi:transcriptional regulator with XRE-family HTH domain